MSARLGAKMSQSGDDQHSKRDEDRAADLGTVKQRLEALEDRLKDVRDRRTAEEPSDRRRGQALGIAFRLSVEMVVGVAVGGVMGWYLDSWLGTRPLLLIVFLLLGSGAGILNAVRAARELQRNRPDAEASKPGAGGTETRGDESGNGAPG